MLIDSHCHPHFPPLGDDIAAVLADMESHNVDAAMAVATSGDDCQTVVRLAKKYPRRFFAACGIHPLTDCGDDEKTESAAAIIAYCRDDSVLAVGETGLDFFRGLQTEKRQRKRFAAHIAAAKELKKPLIIHTRDSLAATLEMLRAEKAGEVGGVLHCYTGDAKTAKAALDINFILSFSAIVMFKNADDIRAAAKFAPSNAYLVETDSPYLAPPPHRGKTNTPGFVRHIAKALATVRGVDEKQVETETSANFNRLFRPPKKTT